jgi:hypothetical protein
MNKGTKKSIVQQVVQLAASAIIDQEQIKHIMQNFVSDKEILASDIEKPVRLIRLITSEGIIFMLVDNAVNKYEKLLQQLLQHEGWQEKFSAEYLDKAIQRIVATLLKESETESAERLFDQLVNEYETFSSEYVVYVPLAGINLHADSFPIGNIQLRKMADAFIDELFDKAKTVTVLTLNSPEEKDANNAWTRRRLESLKGGVCAEFYAIAEPQRVRERAEKEIREVLDLLRYAISVLSERGLKIAVGLHGEVTSAVQTTFIFALDGQSFQEHSTRVGSLSGFELTPENIGKMEQIGIFKVAEILKQPRKVTDFERMLLRGIHWFATSQTQFERENELLNLMTCLETIFTRSGQGIIGPSIAEQVADGVARLLTTDLKNRNAQKQRIKDLYGMRSGVSHGGAKVILEADLKYLRNIAKELIFQMIELKDKYTTHEAFLKWLDERKLTG